MQRLDVERQRAVGEIEAQAALETVVPQEAEHRGVRPASETSAVIAWPVRIAGSAAAAVARAVGLDEIAAVPARVAVAQVALDVAGAAEAQAERGEAALPAEAAKATGELEFAAPSRDVQLEMPARVERPPDAPIRSFTAVGRTRHEFREPPRAPIRR